MTIDLHALLDAHQSTRLLRLSFQKYDGPQAKLMVNRFQGTEYLSRDFEFKLELLSDAALSIYGVLGAGHQRARRYSDAGGAQL